MLSEDFDLWLRVKFTDEFWLRGHRFEKTKNEEVLVDGGVFTKNEAKHLFKLIISRNPLDRLNATLLMWERNGALIKILIILALLMLILVYIRVKR